MPPFRRPGVFVSSEMLDNPLLEEMDRLPPLPRGLLPGEPDPRKRFQHDCEKCYYLGSIELDGRHYDYYRCDKQPAGRTYIARYGSEGYEYASWPNVLEQLGNTIDCPTPDVAVAKVEQLIDDSEFGNKEFRFCLICEENMMTTIVSPLLPARRRRYIEDAVEHFGPRFQFEYANPETMFRFSQQISQSVMRQIRELR